jgi:hypothetical protein
MSDTVIAAITAHRHRGKQPQSRGASIMSIKAVVSSSVLTVAASLLAGGEAHAQAGLLTGGATELEPITLSSGQPLASAPYELESGKYYRIPINADGTAEIAIEGPEFFRNVWVDEVVINDIEVRPLGVSSLEFDDEGTATISFVTIRPGQFILRIPGTTGETQQAIFNVK